MSQRNKSHRSQYAYGSRRENRISNAIFVFLIASLPFFTFRTQSIDGSITNVAMILVLTFALVSALTGKLNLRRLGLFEFAHVVFLFLATVSILQVNIPDSTQALAKSSLYFAFYIGLVAMLSDFSALRLQRLILTSARIGVAAFSVLFLLALIQSGVLRTVFSSGLDFYSFTFRVYQQMFDLLSLNYEITPREIRRNTIGGIFAFFFGVLLLAQTSWASTQKRTKIDLNVILLGLCLVFVILLFSRRALIACVLMVLYVSLTNNVSRGRLIVIILVGVGAILFAFIGLGVENRFVDLGDDSRFQQFSLAIESFLQNPMSGVGYGAKAITGNTVFRELYVHNYVLGNMYMLGVPGLLFSMFVLWFIASKAIKALRGRTEPIQMLLIIPLLSMMVASAVEGIYVPLSWIIFAICFHGFSRKENLRQRRSYRTREGLNKPSSVA